MLDLITQGQNRAGRKEIPEGHSEESFFGSAV
jgi:hypothetical protein